MRTTILPWIFSGFFVLLFSCGKTKPLPEVEDVVEPLTPREMIQLGQKLFNGKGTCNSCHQVDQKTVGPSIREIISVYDQYQVSIVTFLKGDGEAIVDPKQFIIMQANFAITKKMRTQELEAIEAYMRSL